MRRSHFKLVSAIRLLPNPSVSRYRRRLSRYAPQKQSAGLFGLDGLHKPEDWKRIAALCVSDCLHLADNIKKCQRGGVDILQVYDDMSDRLCSVLDVAELCRNVHPDQEFVEAAHDAFSEVSKVTHHFNSDYVLYRPLRRLLDECEGEKGRSGERSCDFSSEDVTMLKSLTHDFERGGIHLSQSEKESLLKLQHEIDGLCGRFLSNQEETGTSVLLTSRNLNDIPPHLRQQLDVKLSNKRERKVSISARNANILLKWITDSRDREKVFRSIHSVRQREKSITLDALLESRKKLAKLLGRGSYADLLFTDRLASSPEQISKFLRNMSSAIHGSAQRERNAIEVEKLRRESHLAAGQSTAVCGWDRSFYMGRIKAQEYGLSSHEVSQYLPLGACLEGLTHITQSIFGVHLTRVEPFEGEIWHKDVQKFSLVGDRSEVLGTIYFDLFPRHGKYPHAAHFSIRCGRQPADTSEYQLPVVALVCNFGEPQSNSQRLLTISEYETLFHEFGHSLHSLLSRTRYQHLSGTRVVTDFVEIPSHLFEHFAWDPRIVSQIARHHKTGKPMPSRLVTALAASRNSFAASDAQMQILFSVMDLEFHGCHPPVGRTTEAFEGLQRSLTVFPPDKGVAIPASFHHFVGYGAGYYSYILARVVAAQLWTTLFEKDPLSRTGGSLVRNQFLACGGARHPSTILGALLHGPVTCDAFFRKLGTPAMERSSRLHLPLSRLEP